MLLLILFLLFFRPYYSFRVAPSVSPSLLSIPLKRGVLKATSTPSQLNCPRFVFLISEINNDCANEVIAKLKYFEDLNNLPIYLFINSAGGSVASGLAICDAMQQLRSEVVTVNLGFAASSASLILASGSFGRRYGMFHSTALLHQADGNTFGRAKDVLSHGIQIRSIVDVIQRSYNQHTFQFTKISRTFALTAQEALQVGIIDKIIRDKSLNSILY